MLLLPLILCN
uniref:Uncharacterized protein n=1 Tax=Rhizophora mucronata TaxID=61149 RepID=A0A2P2PMV6_RHIMU